MNVVADPDRVAQVVENLVVNALAATERGEVTVSVRATPGGAEITVADTGLGTEPESADRVFERFHRGPGGHAGGSGLGLTIGRRHGPGPGRPHGQLPGPGPRIHLRVQPRSNARR